MSAAEPFTEYLHESVARFVDPSSAGSIAAAVDQLLSDPLGRARLASRGVEHVQKFSWEQVARQHERLYDELLARPLHHPSSTFVYEELAHA